MGHPIETLTQMEEAAKEIASLGPKGVLVKGGHLAGDATDILYWQGKMHYFPSPRIESTHTHGTGCTLSSAIAAYIARGFSMEEAVLKGKEYITEAIRQAKPLGQGHGPVHHFWNWTDWGKEEPK